MATVKLRIKKGHGAHVMKGKKTVTLKKAGDVVEFSEYEAERRLENDSGKWEEVVDGEVKKKSMVRTAKTTAPKVGLIKEPIEDTDLFDVINEKTGKPINDEPLSEEDADSLISDLGNG